jgi:hypothetical protein
MGDDYIKLNTQTRILKITKSQVTYTHTHIKETGWEFNEAFVQLREHHYKTTHLGLLIVKLVSNLVFLLYENVKLIYSLV